MNKQERWADLLCRLAQNSFLGFDWAINRPVSWNNCIRTSSTSLYSAIELYTVRNPNVYYFFLVNSQCILLFFFMNSQCILLTQTPVFLLHFETLALISIIYNYTYKNIYITPLSLFSFFKKRRKIEWAFAISWRNYIFCQNIYLIGKG